MSENTESLNLSNLARVIRLHVWVYLTYLLIYLKYLKANSRDDQINC